MAHMFVPSHPTNHPYPREFAIPDMNHDDEGDMKPAAKKVKRETEYDASTTATYGDRPVLLLPSRQEEFSSHSWWMVDLDGDELPKQGATVLVKRCMRKHGWDLQKSRKILSAYKQFLTIKKEHKDWDATLLSPCYLVDMMWHQHILDNIDYYHDMILLCGHFVGHNPDGALDVEAKVKRDAYTRECLSQTFGRYDIDVWDNNMNAGRGDLEAVESVGRERNGQVDGADADANADVDESADNGQEDIDAAGADAAAGNDAGAAAQQVVVLGNGDIGDGQNRIVIRVKDQTGEETLFRVKRAMRMSNMFRAYAIRKVEMDALAFFGTDHTLLVMTPQQA